MTTPDDEPCDVVVIGGGIAGLGAALELQERGLRVRLFEKEAKVGGRMTTDRVAGFAIDRGATIFGGEFANMRALVKKLGLAGRAQRFDFKFGLRDSGNLMVLGRARPDRLLFGKHAGWRAKLAMARFGLCVMRARRKLRHGQSSSAIHLDTESVAQFLDYPGGREFLDGVLLPALNGPFGGNLRRQSKLVLFQTVWNILIHGTWAMRGGMDQIPEAMARRLPVETDCAVTKVEIGERCRVVATRQGVETTVFARGVVFAIPGQYVPDLCPGLPVEVLGELRATRYGAMTSAHVLLNRPPHTAVAGYGVSAAFGQGYEIELEHNRVAEMCPDGGAQVSIYFWDEAPHFASRQDDHEVGRRARGIIDDCFPECADAIVGIHILRWRDGIAYLPPGRLAQMAALRRRMKSWNLPVQLCGDYLDGISTEGALATGRQAARNMARRLRGGKA